MSDPMEFEGILAAAYIRQHLLPRVSTEAFGGRGERLAGQGRERPQEAPSPARQFYSLANDEARLRALEDSSGVNDD